MTTNTAHGAAVLRRNDGVSQRIAFQGELGAFSEEAVQRVFGVDEEPVPCRENREVARRVANGDADAGVAFRRIVYVRSIWLCDARNESGHRARLRGGRVE